MIDDRTIERIKSVANVVDVVSDFIELRRSGVELTAPCPLHGGQHLDHFKVSPRKNMYYCFVCGKGGGPIDWLMEYEGLSYPDAIRWLGRKYNIVVDEEQKQPRFAHVRPSDPKPIELPPELPTLELPLALVVANRDTSNDVFCNWLRQLPWNKEQADRVERVLEAYCVGSAKERGMTIFWQIDHMGKIHTGKLMRYKADGHRDKSDGYNKDWIHAILARKRSDSDPWPHPELFNPDEQQMRPCLFGLHLVHAKGVQVWDANIVESEKSAIIMAIAQGGSHGIWLATGGMQFLKREMLQPLLDLGMNIVLHPDHDGDERWRKKMSDLGYRYGVDYQVSNFYTTVAWKEQDGEKADCADIVIRQMDDARRSNMTYKLKDVIDRQPSLKTLIDKLDLEIVK